MWSSGQSRGLSCTSMGSVVGATVFLNFLTISLMPSCSTALILNYTTRGCSKHCESINCDNPHTIRYGKFCGVGYTGCPNQAPCDRLDGCCRQHDLCVGTNPANFSNQTCRYNLKSCLQQYLTTGAVVYHGSNCSAMTVQNTLMVGLDGTTYHVLAPGSTPQAGGAPTFSAKLLNCIVTFLLCCSCASLFIARDLTFIRT